MKVTAEQAVNGNRYVVVQISPRRFAIAKPSLADWEFQLMDGEVYDNPNEAKRQAAIMNGADPREV